MQLTRVLDEYEWDVDTMIRCWGEMDTYLPVSEKIETLRRLSSALREVQGPWVELLIAHGELVFALWSKRYGNRHIGSRDVKSAREQHSACIAALRMRCLKLLAEQQSEGEPG